MWRVLAGCNFGGLLFLVREIPMYNEQYNSTEREGRLDGWNVMKFGTARFRRFNALSS